MIWLMLLMLADDKPADKKPEVIKASTEEVAILKMDQYAMNSNSKDVEAEFEKEIAPIRERLRALLQKAQEPFQNETEAIMIKHCAEAKIKREDCEVDFTTREFHAKKAPEQKKQP